MNFEIILTSSPINIESLSRETSVPKTVGAVITFTGLVRGMEGNVAISALEYECFEKMAQYQFKLIFKQVSVRWPVEFIRLVHRIGFVNVGESSLWIQVAAPHRAEAFEACEWIVDEMKRVVPIWKKLVYAPIKGPGA